MCMGMNLTLSLVTWTCVAGIKYLIKWSMVGCIYHPSAIGKPSLRVMWVSNVLLLFCLLVPLVIYLWQKFPCILIACDLI